MTSSLGLDASSRSIKDRIMNNTELVKSDFVSRDLLTFNDGKYALIDISNTGRRKNTD